MYKERTDRKGRHLRHGEDQMPDGRYRYRYQDDNGLRHAVYSWKLLPADRLPAGKRCGISLREKEEQIERDRRDGIDALNARKLTLNQVFSAYLDSRPELKPTTRNNYRYLYRTYVSETLGKRKISAIRYSDIRQFYLTLLTEGAVIRQRDGTAVRGRPLKFGSVHLIHTILSPVFACAVRDDLIRKNPCPPAMKELRKAYFDPGDR